jgi:hypothetical protein
MKFSLSIVIACAAAANAVVTPYSVPLEALLATSPVDDDSFFMDALTMTGMFTVTDLPASFKSAMRTMTATQHECLMKSSNTQEQTYPDGTVRVTLGTRTVAGVGGKQPLNHKTNNVEVCARFEEAANIVRETTQMVVGAFSSKMTSLLDVTDGPLLMTEAWEDEIPFSFDTFTDVVENGEHLEHFHSYQKKAKAEVTTIDVHTDQGLFLVFTPGRLSSGKLTSGFYIQTTEGETEEVTFSEADDLVFMMGDGVNQYLNNKIEDSNKKLRAVPHAVQLESSTDARIWYGLMVLPPASAIHPMYMDVTFGQLRQGLVAGDKDMIQLACSNSDYSVVTNHRMLDGVNQTCNNTEEVYCWHRCMNSTLFNVSQAICSSQERELKCINPRDQVWLGVKHGDLFPGCAASDWPNETDFTSLPNFPRDDAKCSNFATFYNDGMYANSMPLKDGVGAVFQYNVTSDGNIDGRLAYNGIFGYLSVGFQGVGRRLTMFNAPIILAIPGGNYTPKYGVDLKLEPEVHEYITSLNQTAFRHWSIPYDHDEDEHSDGGNATATSRSSGRLLHGNESHYRVATESGDCYTALYFELKSIAGQDINMMGKDTFIWAANRNDTYVGYHGKDRGNFTIEWMAKNGGYVEAKDTTNTTTGTKTSGSASFSMMIGGIVSVGLMFFTSI